MEFFDILTEAVLRGIHDTWMSHMVPQTPDHLKTQTCEEAFNPDGLAQRSIALLKDTFPDLEVCQALPLRAPHMSFLKPARMADPGPRT